MEKMDVIKFIKAQIDTEMAKLKDAKDDDIVCLGKNPCLHRCHKNASGGLPGRLCRGHRQ